MIPVIAAIFAIGVLLAFIGRWGIRIDEHPVCASCRFDLAGIHPGKPEQRCPECGSPLGRRGAVRTGNRRRIRWLIATGAILAGISSVRLAVTVFDWANRANWAWLTPESWLDTDTQSGVTRREDAALVELARRHAIGRSSANMDAALVERALARQADPVARWSDAWSDFLDAAVREGRLSTEQMAAYAHAAITVSVRGGPTATDGLEWPLSVRIGGGRVSQNTRFRAFYMIQRFAIDGIEQGPLPVGRLGVEGSGGGAPGGHDMFIMIHCPPGERTAHITLQFEVRARTPDAPLTSPWSEEFSFPLDVVAP